MKYPFLETTPGTVEHPIKYLGMQDQYLYQYQRPGIQHPKMLDTAQKEKQSENV
jgi:hypothetical protein